MIFIIFSAVYIYLIEYKKKKYFVYVRHIKPKRLKISIFTFYLVQGVLEITFSRKVVC